MRTSPLCARRSRVCNDWYWENYTSQFESARNTGRIYGAAGTALVSGAARNDYAEAAAEVIVRPGQEGKVYELAGAPALDYPGIAAAIGAVIASDVTYTDLSEADLVSALEQTGMPNPVAQFVAAMDTAIAHGALHADGDALSSLLGRPTATAEQALVA